MKTNKQARSGRVTRGVIYKIFHFLFVDGEDSVTVNKKNKICIF